ncbi:MAG: TonB-dependent receptor plug domain-containing protein [Longimicrobiales bacterium]
MDRTREGRAFHLRSFSRRALLFPILSILPLLLFPGSTSCQVQPVQLEGIIVTGTPVPRTAGSEASFVTVLDGEELRARGVARVADALAEVPGLVVVQNGSYGSVTSTFFRGSEADHVKVLVDGIEVNQAGGSYDFSSLLLFDVERIEVARGPASALYGSDAVAGVINVLTRRGHGSPRVSVSARAGSYGRKEWGADVHGGSPNTSYSFSASSMASDGILEFNNHFKAKTLSGSVFATPDEKTRLSLSGRYGDRVYHYPTDGSGNVLDRNAFTYGDEAILGLGASRMFSDRIELTGVMRTYGWDGGSDDQPDGPEDNVGYFGYTSMDSFRRTSMDLRANLALSSRAVLSAGVELEEESQRSFSESLSEDGPSSGKSRYQRANRGYYTHLTTEGSTWSGNLGVRLEDNEQYGSFLTYQVGVSYALPSTGTRLRGTLGRGLKEPTFVETSSSGFTMGNPNLDPERSQVWEVGMEQGVGRSGATFALTWFHQSLKDLIQYSFLPPEPGGPNFYNVAEARSRGLEAATRIPFGSGLLTGGYTYLDTEVVDAGFDEGDGAVFVEGEALIRRPKHQINVGASYRVSGGGFYGNMRLVGSRYDRDFTGWPAAPVELSRFLLVEIGGDLEILEPTGGRPGLSVQLRIENLLDERYQEVFGFQAPGRAFLLGGRLLLGEAN